MKKVLAYIFALSLISSASFSQNVAACNNAQPVCTNPNFNFTSSAGSGLVSGLNVSNPTTNPQMGNGNNPLAPANSGCLLSQGPGPQWLLITVSSNGTLVFLLVLQEVLILKLVFTIGLCGLFLLQLVRIFSTILYLLFLVIGTHQVVAGPEWALFRQGHR